MDRAGRGKGRIRGPVPRAQGVSSSRVATFQSDKLGPCEGVGANEFVWHVLVDELNLLDLIQPAGEEAVDLRLRDHLVATAENEIGPNEG